MKKILLLAFVFISVTCFSQMKLGIEVGWNRASFNQVEPTQYFYSITSSPINSFNLGVTGQLPLHHKLFLHTSLLYFGEGTKQLGGGGDPAYLGYSTTTLHVYYLKLPVDILYKIKLNKKINVFGGGGLYAALGLSGNIKGTNYGIKDPTDSLQVITQIDDKIKFANNNNNNYSNVARPFDFGYNFLAGVDRKSWSLFANYSKGFSKAYYNTGYHFKNECLSISVIYFFSLKK